MRMTPPQCVWTPWEPSATRRCAGRDPLVASVAAARAFCRRTRRQLMHPTAHTASRQADERGITASPALRERAHITYGGSAGGCTKTDVTRRADAPARSA